MSLILLIATVATGWVLAIGLQTRRGWRTPVTWLGWQDVHPFHRCLVVGGASWLLQALINENGRPQGVLEGISAGCYILKVVLGIALAYHTANWAIHAHSAYELLRGAGLTDDEIYALNNVGSASSGQEVSRSLSGYTKLATRVGVVQQALTRPSELRELEPDETAGS